MLRVIFLLLGTLLSFAAYADPACEPPYGVCMADCATDRAAERCMQRCMGARNQCIIRNSSKKIPEQEMLTDVGAKAKQSSPRQSRTSR